MLKKFNQFFEKLKIKDSIFLNIYSGKIKEMKLDRPTYAGLLSTIQPYCYNFSKMIKVPFSRDETLSRKNGTLIQYWTKTKPNRSYLYGTGSKLRYFKTKFCLEKTEHWTSYENRKKKILLVRWNYEVLN